MLTSEQILRARKFQDSLERAGGEIRDGATAATSRPELFCAQELYVALREAWLQMRNDASHLGGVKLVVAELGRSGALSPEMTELWERRLDSCPGHDDEGGRAWCAYCGDMPEGDADG